MSSPLFLQPHPGTRADYIESIAVEVSVSPSGALQLIYTVSGDLAALRIPRITPTSRSDGLWQHTCCEAFIRSAESPAYREFNFSPSGQWQAYTFADYRNGGLLEQAADPEIACHAELDCLTLHAKIRAADLPSGIRLRLGLTAVLESREGDISYWALHHAAGKPDFHHPDTFVLDIAHEIRT